MQFPCRYAALDSFLLCPMLTLLAAREAVQERSALKEKKSFKMYTPDQLDELSEEQLGEWLELVEDGIQRKRESSSPMKRRRI